MNRWIVGILVCCVVAAMPVFVHGATVELKDGTTVTGTIEGKVILGGRLDEKKPGDRKFVPGGIFFIVTGSNIVSITKAGVETGKDASTPWALFAGKKLPATPDVLNVVEKLGDLSTFNEGMQKGMGMGMAQFSSNYDKSPIGVALMGEYANGTMTPSLRVTTESGVRTIPVEQVVAYVSESKP